LIFCDNQQGHMYSEFERTWTMIFEIQPVCGPDTGGCGFYIIN
jgi:hypothetical protein